MGKQWYVIQTQSGHEDRVKSSIEGRARIAGQDGLFGRVMIPTEQVSEVKGGKKKISQRKFFPGYVLVEMDLTEETWYLVKTTPGVSRFIGSGMRPLPLADEEVAHILKQTEEKREKPTPKVLFQKGDGVRVTEGPFTNFTGTVEDVNPNKGRLKVMVSIFGRSTPVELEYWQVEAL